MMCTCGTPGDLERTEVWRYARLVLAVNLQAEEAQLTGKSVPVEKLVAPVRADTPLAERRSMVYAGTGITDGRSHALVVSTGQHTEVGRIARLLEAVETPRMPLQQNVDRVGHQLARAALVVVGLILALGLLRGQPLVEMLVFGVALAVAVVPEALPAVVTISLALGVPDTLASARRRSASRTGPARSR